MNPTPDFRDGFTLALGGGGGRGWAHLGVARALEAHGLRASRIVGTSMGAIIGAALAAGRSPAEIEDAGRRLSLYRNVRRGRLSLFDPRPVLDRLAADLGDPRIEDLSIPIGITTYDLVTGRPRLITTGRLVDALEKSIAVPLFFPPRQDAEGIWCDAGPWEGVPVSLARAWAPDDPVIGVVVVGTKPGVPDQRPERGTPSSHVVTARDGFPDAASDRSRLPRAAGRALCRSGRRRGAGSPDLTAIGEGERAAVRAHRRAGGHR